MVPSEAIVPAKSPAVPAAVDGELPSFGTSPTVTADEVGTGIALGYKTG